MDLILEPDGPPLFIGSVPAFPDHRLLCESRDVYLTFERLRHIRDRRTSKSEAPYTFVVRNLALVVGRPTHIGPIKRNARTVEIYSHVPEDISTGVLVSLKCLDGETWINTAFPLGARNLLRYIRQGRLIPVERGPP